MLEDELLDMNMDLEAEAEPEVEPVKTKKPKKGSKKHPIEKETPPIGTSRMTWILKHKERLPETVWVKLKKGNFQYHKAATKKASDYPYMIKSSEWLMITDFRDVAFFLIRKEAAPSVYHVVKKAPKKWLAAQKLHAESQRKEVPNHVKLSMGVTK